MLATVAAADIAYNEAEPHTMYAIYKQRRSLSVLQYLLLIFLDAQIFLNSFIPDVIQIGMTFPVIPFWPKYFL